MPTDGLTYSIREAKVDTRNLLPELLMVRQTNKQRCWLLVEGSDDMSVLQRFRGEHCEIRSLNGRNNVLHSIRRASFQASKLDGIVGLIDRDFDHLATTREALPIRCQYSCPRFCDIEASILCFRGAELLDVLTDAKERTASPWFRFATDEPLDLLAENVAARIGAVRALYHDLGLGTSYGSLDQTGDFIDRTWNRSLASSPLTFEAVARGLPQLPQNHFQELRRRWNNLVAEKGERDPWDLVRGKDLVRCIAHALADDPKICLFREGLEQIAARTQQRLLGLVDQRHLEEAELLLAIEKACSQDSQRYQYLRTA